MSLFFSFSNYFKSVFLNEDRRLSFWTEMLAEIKQKNSGIMYDHDLDQIGDGRLTPYLWNAKLK